MQDPYWTLEDVKTFSSWLVQHGAKLVRVRETNNGQYLMDIETIAGYSAEALMKQFEKEKKSK